MNNITPFDEKHNEEVVIVNTDCFDTPKEGNDIFESRLKISSLLHGEASPEVSVLVLAYDRLSKTKNCVESVLKYTDDVDYELVLVDNGSQPDTLAYFESVVFEKKKIVRISKNMQLSFGMLTGYKYCSGKYIAFLNNDMVVTKRWLSNIMKCFESDGRIGLICTMSSNISNLQDAGLKFSNNDEMQYEAEKYNISDSGKWHERLRLITAGAVYKTECIDICGNWDYGFFHDFADDDLTFHIRRAGYKTILCKDVFVHHDHPAGADKAPGELRKSLEKGRENFKKKYHGVDAWEDVNNYETNIVNMIGKPSLNKDINILGVDVRCGTPILEAKNRLRQFNMHDVTLSSFTETAKYYVDLSTICEGQVECDRIEYISEHFNREYFDIIILGKEINIYSEPLKLLNDCISLLKNEGQLFVKLHNSNDVTSFLTNIGDKSYIDTEIYYLQWHINDLCNWVKKMNCKVKEINKENYTINVTTRNKILSILKSAMLSKNISKKIEELLVASYVIKIAK